MKLITRSEMARMPFMTQLYLSLAFCDEGMNRDHGDEMRVRYPRTEIYACASVESAIVYKIGASRCAG